MHSMENTLPNTPSPHQDNNVFIGAGVLFTGSMNVPNRAVIAGQFNGDLQAREVFIDSTGRLTGTTLAEDIEVKGDINETITSRHLLTVRSSGKVKGKLAYASIEIERGGQVSGDMTQG
jgi:cytoskeletal protein CcmA (bactofilin family)